MTPHDADTAHPSSTGAEEASGREVANRTHRETPGAEPSGPGDEAKGLSRRQFLGLAGLGALAFGLGGAGGLALDRKIGEGIHSDLMSLQYPFRGEHQSGILTPAQQQMHTAAFDLTISKREDLEELLADWSLAIERMMAADPVKDHSTELDAAPVDTGETIGSGAAGLTITIGVGKTLFRDADGKDRFGLAHKTPRALEEGIPKMAAEKLDPMRGGGDLIIQACSEDPMVNLHALHNLTKIAFGRATMRWTQLGYGRTSSTSTAQETPRNLFGFKDGTSNIKGEEPPAELDRHVWIQPGDDQGSWAAGGTYMCMRKIKMMMEVWDGLTLRDQQDTIGRDKFHGAPLSGGEEFTAPDFSKNEGGAPLIDPSSHVAMMHPDNNNGRRMLRRGYNYLEGVDYLGRLEAGLFFLAFVRDPAEGFIPILAKMAGDRLTEYLQHLASGVYLILPGITKDEPYIGHTLLA